MKKFIAGVMTGLCLVSGVSSCSHAPEFKPTSYETLEVQPKNIVVVSKWSTKVEGVKVEITPQVSAIISDKPDLQGKRVKNGDVICRLDDRKAQAELDNAKANLAAEIANSSSLELEYITTKNLFEKGIVSSYVLQKAENDWVRSKANVEQAKAQVSRAELNLSYYTLKSPVDGVVGKMSGSAGSQVSPSTVIATIIKDESMTANFSLSEDQVQQILVELGSLEQAKTQVPDVTLKLKDGYEYEHKGRVSGFTGMIDQTTGSITCKAKFPNPDKKLYSGIHGTIEMPFEYENVLVVPESAILRLQDKTLVYVVDDTNCAKSTIVKVESVGNGQDAVVLEGLKAGDRIVTVGVQNLVDGQQVIFPEENTESEK